MNKIIDGRKEEGNIKILRLAMGVL